MFLFVFLLIDKTNTFYFSTIDDVVVGGYTNTSNHSQTHSFNHHKQMKINIIKGISQPSDQQQLLWTVKQERI